MFGLFKRRQKQQDSQQPLSEQSLTPLPESDSPLVPAWKPEITQAMDTLVSRMGQFTQHQRDFVIFKHGTIVLLPEGLGDADATSHALKALSQVFHAHPDIEPVMLDNGDVLVRYYHDAINLILHETGEAWADQIEQHHLDALTPDEVLVTPLGPNQFDEFGKRALFGRCYMFMDAQSPEISHIHRMIPEQVSQL